MVQTIILTIGPGAPPGWTAPADGAPTVANPESPREAAVDLHLEEI